MTTTTAPTPVAVRWRRATVAVLGTAAAAALSTAAIPGPDALLGGWFLSGVEIIHRVHEVGFGLIMTVCIAVPFLAQAVAPRRAVSFAWAAVASPAATIVALAAASLLNLGFVGALSAHAAVAAIAAATLYLALVWRPDDAPDPMPTRRWPA